MRSEYILFGIYVLLSVWSIPKISFIRNTNLTHFQIRLLLCFKLLSGLVLAYYFENISTNKDYLTSNAEGALQYNLLVSNPKLFFTDFSNDITTYGFNGLFQSSNSFWAYLRFNLLYKFVAILNLITHGNFYFNSMIFCTLAFFSHIAFFRIYYSIYKAHKWKLLLACFCLPSLFMYTACIHKDGIIFVFLGLISYVLYRLLSRLPVIKPKYIFISIISSLFIFLFRNYVFVALAPAILIGFVCLKFAHQKRYAIAACYIAFIAAFFITGVSNSSFNLPSTVVQRKADFATLDVGATNIPMNELQPNFGSFAKNLPQAINHSLLRPYLWEFPQFSVILTAVELAFYQLLILLFIFYRKKDGSPIHPFNIFGLALFFNMILIIGYTIPNVGAIVRYRSIYWIFLICPVICNINWDRLLAGFNPKARIK